MDLATLEETNRLRESMGMKPLPVPGQAPTKTSGGDSGSGSDGGDDDDDDDDPLGTLDGRHAAAFDNYRKLQEAEQAKKRRQEKAEAVKRAREKAQRHALLAGKTLADAGVDDDLGADADAALAGDARAWLRGQKKRQKKISAAEAAQQAREAAEAEAKAKALGDGADSLAGVRVGHDMGALLDGGDEMQILTLKDAAVLANDGGDDDDDDAAKQDELENLALREQENLQERLNLKKKRPGYDPLADEEAGGARTILGHYDEEIYGKKRKHFTLDPNILLGPGSGGAASGGPAAPRQADGVLSTAAAIDRTQDMSNLDDIVSGGPSSDYLAPSEIKIRKPKKKSKKVPKATRQRSGFDDDNDGEVAAAATEENAAAPTEMEVDGGDGAAAAAAAAQLRRKRRAALDEEDDIFRDEETLQATLALQRREALKKRKRLRPADLAKALRDDGAAEAENGGEEDGMNANGVGSGLVIDETAEFLSSLTRRKDRDEDAERRTRQRSRTPGARATSEALSEAGGDTAMKDESSEEEEQAQEQALDHAGAAGLEEEKKISEGMGATLALLRGRGILEGETKRRKKQQQQQQQQPRVGNVNGVDSDSDDGDGAGRLARVRAHEQFVAEKRLRLAQMEEEARRQRERDRTTGPAARMTAREREEYARKQNVQRELQTGQVLQELFSKRYTPSFALEYKDEHGRVLDAKDAFRELSHGFHGKTSGRGKTDKLLKKIEAEKRQMAQGILDTSQSVGMSSATAQQLKKRKEAGVRLD